MVTHFTCHFNYVSLNYQDSVHYHSLTNWIEAMTEKKKQPGIPPDLKNWKGNFDELVSTSSQVLSQISPGTSLPSGSVIRYYQQQGVVGRGTPKGRTREFSTKELEQVITAKQMAEKNIPLSLVKSALEAETGKSPAELLVSEMMNSAGLGTVKKQVKDQHNPLLATSASNLISPSPFYTQRRASESSDEQASQYVTLPAGGTVRYELGSGVVVEMSTQEKTEDQAEALRCFAQQLIDGTKIDPKTT